MSELLEIPGEKKKWVLKRHRILGKGSFGCATLYEELNTPGSFVVVKDINMQTMKKDDEMQALKMEVSILRRSCGHPNIVQFLDYYHDGEFMVYIIMEYCASGDLAQLEEQLRYRALHKSEDFVASILIQTLVGLHFLHVEQHTLHRDIKPQNLFLCKDDSLRIGDFGVSTILEEISGVAKMVCGSPFYMAPELCEEKAYDGKADIWSLGVTIYELIMLERPFNASSVPGLIQQITRGVFPPIPSTLSYSNALIELVQSFLQTSPTTRPTLRRALRSSYVQSKLSCLPRSCLESEYYRKLFGEELVQRAVQTQSRNAATRPTCKENNDNNNVKKGSKYNGVNSISSLSSSSLHNMSELDMWLETTGDAVDALMDTKHHGKKLTEKKQNKQQELEKISKDIIKTVDVPIVVSKCKNNIEIEEKNKSSDQTDNNSNDDDRWNEAYEDDFESSCSSNSKTES